MRIAVGLAVIAILLAGCDLLPAPIRPPVTRAEAVDIARSHAPPHLSGAGLLSARQVTYAEVANEFAQLIEGPRPDPDDCVWAIDLGSITGPLMGSGIIVVVDCASGRAIHAIEWIS